MSRCCRTRTHYANGVTLTWSPAEATHLVLWRSPDDGRRRKARANDHEEAAALAVDVATRLGQGPARPVVATGRAPRGLRVPDLVADYLRVEAPARGWSESYRRRCESAMRVWIEPHLNVAVSSWHAADTAALLEAAGTLSASSRKQLLSLLTGAAEHARTRGWLDHDPCAGFKVRTPRRHKPVAAVARHDGSTAFVEVDERPTTADVERLADAFDRHDHALAARLAAYTGLRRGELFALEAADVCFDRDVIHVERRVDNTRVGRNGPIMSDDGRRPRYWPTPLRVCRPAQGRQDAHHSAATPPARRARPARRPRRPAVSQRPRPLPHRQQLRPTSLRHRTQARRLAQRRRRPLAPTTSRSKTSGSVTVPASSGS